MADVIKTIPAKPAVKPISSQPAATVTVDPITKKITTLLDTYKQLLTGRSISLKNGKAAAINLVTATNLLLANPTKDNAAVFWNFHKENKNGVCRETVALTGIDQAADRKTKLQVTTLYNTIRCFIMGYTPIIGSDEFVKVIPAAMLYRYISRFR